MATSRHVAVADSVVPEWERELFPLLLESGRSRMDRWGGLL